MDKPTLNQRSKQFGYCFAQLVVDELRQKAHITVHPNSAYSYVEPLIEMIIRQRAYDLVKYTLLHVDHVDLDSHSIEEHIEKIPDLTEMSNHPDTTPQLAMSQARLRELIFLAIGRAGMCWSEIPSGTFDDAKAQQIGEELLNAIHDLQTGKR